MFVINGVDPRWFYFVGSRCLLGLLTTQTDVFVVLCSCAGEALGSVPLLEVLDLSWNRGVGGVALQCLLGKLPPPLRELHLVACRLTAADATALGTDVTPSPPGRLLPFQSSYISQNAPGERT